MNLKHDRYFQNGLVRLLIVLGLSTSCSPIPSASPSLGDTRTRSMDEMVMLYVPAGEFQMGSAYEEVERALGLCNDYYGYCDPDWFAVDEQPAHAVVLDGFWIDKTEVTNGQYQRCVAAGACDPPEGSRSHTRDSYYGNSSYNNYPVIDVNFHKAAAYCEWVGARLLTEAEWEYAARGPEESMFPWGEELDGTRLNYCDVNCEFGWADESFDDGYADTAPVGSYSKGASWCGADDMAGNVWEWVADWYSEYPSGQLENPLGPSSGDIRLVRGGGWYDGWSFVRTTYRGHLSPGDRTYYVGLRCAVSLGE